MSYQHKIQPGGSRLPMFTLGTIALVSLVTFACIIRYGFGPLMKERKLKKSCSHAENLIKMELEKQNIETESMSWEE